jgi:hypothetical protein
VEKAGNINAGDLVFRKSHHTGYGLGERSHTGRMTTGIRIPILYDLRKGFRGPEKAILQGFLIFQ